jgi:carboxylesterase type B
VEEIMRAQSTLMGVPRSVGDFFTWGPTLTQERHVHVGGGGRTQSSSTPAAAAATSDIYKQSRRLSTVDPLQDGLLLDWEDYKNHRRKRGSGDRVRDAFAVNVTQPLKNTHLIPGNIPVVIGSNQHEGEMFIHSAFPITMSKPVYWMLVGALFRDSASRVLKHYRGYVEKIEAEANELAKKQVEEEENKLYYLEHNEQLEREYEMLLQLNSSRSSRVLNDDADELKSVVKTWSTGGAQESLDARDSDDGDDSRNSTMSRADKAKAIFSNMRQWPWPPRKRLDIDFNHSSKPPFYAMKKFMNLTKERIPLLRESDPEVAAERAAERDLKRQAKAKEKALKEAAKVVVDYRPVMRRIIDDYLFRCPSWHYAHRVSRNRVQNSEGNSDNSSGRNDDDVEESRSRRKPKHTCKRSRDNNNIYVYR